jgi:hypothetical protein
MQRYLSFATLDVRHDYFADERARHLVFQPHAQTAAFLRRFDMLWRGDGSSLAISVAESQLPGMWSERMDGDAPRLLCFDVRSTDAACAYYTDTAITAAQVESDAVLPAPLLALKAGAAAPLATVGLPLAAADQADFAAWAAALGTTYRLRLRSRSTIWKYLMTGDWHGRRLSIVDQRGEVAFTEPAPESLPDGQRALAARSTTPIALRERPPQRFQLRDVSEAPERILISRLPGATPARLWRETVRGEPTAVSEIFVPS